MKTAKHSKLYTDDEFTKECFVADADTVFPNNPDDI